MSNHDFEQEPLYMTVSSAPGVMEGEELISAIVRIHCREAVKNSHAPRPKKAVVFLIDTSGSMENMTDGGRARSQMSAMEYMQSIGKAKTTSVPKIICAINAAVRGIEMLPEDVWFAVVEFSDKARTAFPMAQATKGNKDRAIAEVKSFEAGGGTAMGQGLMEADRQFRNAPADAIRQVIFLTDGENSNEESANSLANIVDSLKGHFQVAARGVGTGWREPELRQIATALNGTVDYIPDADRIGEFFAEIIEETLNQAIREVKLQLDYLPPGSEITLMRQDEPEIVDFTPPKGSIQNRSWSLSTGSWEANTMRKYRLVIKTPAKPLGTELRIAKLSISTGEGNPPITNKDWLIAARWTNDPRECMHPDIAASDGQQELFNEQVAAIEALEANDVETATKHFGNAARLAKGNSIATKSIETFVKILDAETGKVSLHPMTEEEKRRRSLKGLIESRKTTQKKKS